MRTAQRGFTLIELVVSITISGVLMGAVALMMGAPVQTYLEQSRRNELVDASNRISRTLAIDLQKALPNSVRINDAGSTKVIQLIEVRDVLYYRDEPPADAGLPIADQELRFSSADNKFSAYGAFSGDPSLVVLGSNGNEAYGSGNVLVSLATPAATAFGPHAVSFATPFQFANGPSPTNRLFAINGPITYVCNLNTGRVTRFTNHARNPSMPVDETAPQLNSAGTKSSIVATGVTACSVQCSLPAGNPCQRTLTFAATVTRGNAPDDASINVMQQYPVENTP
jgi:MSHA biogenesis protein MshO